MPLRRASQEQFGFNRSTETEVLKPEISPINYELSFTDRNNEQRTVVKSSDIFTQSNNITRPRDRVLTEDDQSLT
jgi:hypothetical protein